MAKVSGTSFKWLVLRRRPEEAPGTDTSLDAFSLGGTDAGREEDPVDKPIT
ncbi:hypothetical protein RISK_003926 [Rhodopirellula islandica]|uniref:Uncharacterized protein n=1 Tax=Rhodopirellula islandica TaxID=595434 RepID=A0A0J1BBE8_RHOIS|nr:hypothetical protein RISK_003926 [Rhodopirellula islandica]